VHEESPLAAAYALVARIGPFPVMSRRRVLHVVLDLQAGGLERVVADLITGTDHARFELHLLAIRFLGRHAAGLEAFAALHTAPPQSRLSLIRPVALTRTIRGIAPDIVHTHSGVWYKASLAARLAGVPRVLHTDHGRHLPDPWIDRELDARAARRTDLVVAVSDALARQLASTVVGDPGQIRVVRNGVDTQAFAPAPDASPARFDWSSGAIVIGSVGRFDRVKGYDVMLDAFSRFLGEWTGPETLLVLAGEGPEEAALRAMAATLGIAHRVRFVGWRSDTPQLYRSFDLFTLASRSEGTSVSLLEAMSSGVPPVVTDVGGNAAILGPRLAHRLVPAEDPGALAASWMAALADLSARESERRTARARVEADWSLAAMVRHYEALYDQLGSPLS
jgi:glycosyltransferase involved in cell wall biosynthesis